MTYKLCYIDGNHAFFTSNWEKQWGDDWDDTPYEHNAGDPYHHYFDEDGNEISILLKDCYFEIPTRVKLPCDDFYSSPFSVEDINNNEMPWLRIGYDSDDKKYVFAQTSYKQFVEIIEALEGTIYEPKQKQKKERK